MSDAKIIDDGGPAMPCPVGGSSFTGPDGYTSWQYPGSQGLSLRDYFAAKAMQELVRHRERMQTETYTRPELAQEAYHYADAMIAARKATP
jgi:hypothetical protein